MGGDPLSLIFLVQGMAITGRLSGMPSSYTVDFAGSFSMFTLQLAPPAWAKEAMRMKWAGPLFYDETAATEIMRGHFLYSVKHFFLRFCMAWWYVIILTVKVLCLLGSCGNFILFASLRFHCLCNSPQALWRCLYPRGI